MDKSASENYYSIRFGEELQTIVEIFKNDAGEPKDGLNYVFNPEENQRIQKDTFGAIYAFPRPIIREARKIIQSDGGDLSKFDHQIIQRKYAFQKAFYKTPKVFRGDVDENVIAQDDPRLHYIKKADAIDNPLNIRLFYDVADDKGAMAPFKIPENKKTDFFIQVLLSCYQYIETAAAKEIESLSVIQIYTVGNDDDIKCVYVSRKGDKKLIKEASNKSENRDAFYKILDRIAATIGLGNDVLVQFKNLIFKIYHWFLQNDWDNDVGVCSRAMLWGSILTLLTFEGDITVSQDNPVFKPLYRTVQDQQYYVLGSSVSPWPEAPDLGLGQIFSLGQKPRIDTEIQFPWEYPDVREEFLRVMYLLLKEVDALCDEKKIVLYDATKPLVISDQGKRFVYFETEPKSQIQETDIAPENIDEDIGKNIDKNILLFNIEQFLTFVGHFLPACSQTDKYLICYVRDQIEHIWKYLPQMDYDDTLEAIQIAIQDLWCLIDVNSAPRQFWCDASSMWIENNVNIHDNPRVGKRVGSSSAFTPTTSGDS